jgi:hypothetical protein
MNAVLHTDQKRRSEYLDQASRLLGPFNDLIRSYRALGLEHPLSLKDLIALNQPEAWLRQFLLERNQVLQALPLDRPSVLKMIELPAGAQAFFEAHADATGTILRNPRKLPLEHFEETDGEIDFADSLYQFVASKTETRTSSADQLELYNQLQAVYETLHEINLRYPKLQLVGSNQSESLIDLYMGILKFQPVNLKNI